MSDKQKIDLEQLRKGGLVKLKEKDMFSVWVRAVCCNMDAVKLKRVADIAEKYGRGMVLFTTRQFPIIPHIHIKDIDAVQRELREVNLMLDRCGARVRNADVCYDSNICRYAVTNPITLGEKFDEFWRNDPGGYKVKISIAGCQKQCTSPRVLADIGFVGVAEGRYDAYVGGRLGIRPNVGIKMAEALTEEESVKFVENFFRVLRGQGKSGERSADIINRLGADSLKAELNKNLDEKVKYAPLACDTRQRETIYNGSEILRIRATCGEVTSAQVREIAGIAEKYGRGFVHFAVRGAPEIPGVNKKHFGEIRAGLLLAGLEILDGGIDNLQGCFGGYCTNGIMDTQALLRKIEKIVEKLGVNDTNFKISASGCPNSCAISHISDIGFMGVIEPVVNPEKCTGCEVCVKACKVSAIEIKDGIAVIDYKKCRYCTDCINACAFDAITGGKRGYSILTGGRGGYSPEDKTDGETVLGKVIAEFVSEEEALNITERFLKERYQ